MIDENRPGLYRETKKILLVDDNQHILRIISLNIKFTMGPEYEVVEAHNGEEALNVLGKSHAFELVCTNLQMPFVDGIGVVHYINTHLPWIPAILYSCCSYEDIQKQVSTSGIHPEGIIALPADPDVIIGTIDRVIKEAQPRNERPRHITYIPFMCRDDFFTIIVHAGMPEAKAMVRLGLEGDSCVLLLNQEELVEQIKAALDCIENEGAMDFLVWRITVLGDSVHLHANKESTTFQNLTHPVSPHLSFNVPVNEMTCQLKEALAEYYRDMAKWSL
jgi:CheY-like chemotaxis protein